MYSQNEADLIAENARLLDVVRELTDEKRALRNRLVNEIAMHCDGEDREYAIATAEDLVNRFEDAFRAARAHRHAPSND